MSGQTESRPPTTCEICGDAAPHWAAIKGYSHYRCIGCKHLFVHPKPDEATLERYYHPGTYYHSAEQQRSRLQKEAKDRVLLLQELASQFSLERRILDVGCASGIFLKEAIAAGWVVAGVDRSKATVDIAGEEINYPIIWGRLEAVQLPGAPFPVVSAWEVLEHVPDVWGFFRALARCVKPGGLLAISTPLANGLIAKVLGTRFPMLIPPEHLSLFSRKSLQVLADKHGFRPVHYSSFSNLVPRSLSSGICKIVFRSDPETCGAGTRLISHSLGFAMSWLPPIIDAMGVGSEMLMILVKSGPEEMGPLL